MLVAVTAHKAVTARDARLVQGPVRPGVYWFSGRFIVRKLRTNSARRCTELRGKDRQAVVHARNKQRRMHVEQAHIGSVPG
jgi:hypothetical protein